MCPQSRPTLRSVAITSTTPIGSSRCASVDRSSAPFQSRVLRHRHRCLKGPGCGRRYGCDLAAVPAGWRLVVANRHINTTAYRDFPCGSPSNRTARQLTTSLNGQTGSSFTNLVIPAKASSSNPMTTVGRSRCYAVVTHPWTPTPHSHLHFPRKWGARCGINEPIAATFSEPMDASTISAQHHLPNARTSRISGGPVTIAGTTATFGQASLTCTTYTATITTAARTRRKRAASNLYGRYHCRTRAHQTRPHHRDFHIAANAATGVAINQKVSATSVRRWTT